MNICQVNGCTHDGKYDDKCALHCIKSGYQYEGVLSDFNDLLIQYIFADFKKSKPDFNTSFEIFRDYLKGEDNELISLGLQNSISIFNGISFPEYNIQDSTGFNHVLNRLKKIQFGECDFLTKQVHLKNIQVQFYFCVFHREYVISNQGSLLSEISETLYFECTFKEKVNFVESEFDQARIKYSDPVFADCIFMKSLNLNKVSLEAMLFINNDNTQEPFEGMECFNIKNSVFSDKFIFNKHSFESLSIEDCIFESKVELKENKINTVHINNTNFEKLFDAYKSNIDTLKMKKCIFDDFTGFEKCEFGVPNHSEAKGTEFEYVTFLNFTNFRKAKFNNGLDFEHTNLKESPNFLNADINEVNTNRETFRIIKHSFDKIGNQIEANKYFALEMQAYDKELKKEGYSAERFIFSFNKCISNFGSSYIRPFVWMIVSVVLYNLSIWGYENNSLYAICPSINDEINFIFSHANNFAKDIPPYGKFLKEGMEAITLLFYILFSIFTWHFIVAVKRRTKR